MKEICENCRWFTVPDMDNYYEPNRDGYCRCIPEYFGEDGTYVYRWEHCEAFEPKV